VGAQRGQGVHQPVDVGGAAAEADAGSHRRSVIREPWPAPDPVTAASSVFSASHCPADSVPVRSPTRPRRPSTAYWKFDQLAAFASE
jgi:hypothetical protein